MMDAFNMLAWSIGVLCMIWWTFKLTMFAIVTLALSIGQARGDK
jgi:hypothetical protein